jgi:hypothetical protein
MPIEFGCLSDQQPEIPTPARTYMVKYSSCGVAEVPSFLQGCRQAVGFSHRYQQIALVVHNHHAGLKVGHM